MKIILIDVSSLDGKLTKWKGNDVYEWSSREDFMHFQKVKSENNLLVMGSGTFDKVKNLQHAGLKPEKERLRIIMTQKPNQYQQYVVPGQMEFTDEAPLELVTRLEKMGYKQMLLVSGGRVATSFFKEQLIDELWLTLEPKIFGSGAPLIQEGAFDINLKLFDMQKLNNNGTLLLKYQVLKS